MIDNTGVQHLHWGVEGNIICNQEFVPSVNQSITIKVISLENMSTHPNCITQCGDSGCRCVSNSSIQKVDHLLIINSDGKEVACLCGSFQNELLPVSVRSWRALTLTYSINNYAWKKNAFAMQASYAFTMDAVCNQHVYTEHIGLYCCFVVTQFEGFCSCMLNNKQRHSCLIRGFLFMYAA